MKFVENAIELYEMRPRGVEVACHAGCGVHCDMGHAMHSSLVRRATQCQTTPIHPPWSCLSCVPLGIYSKYTKIQQHTYEIYTKYIQFIQNGCLKEAKLSKILFGGRFAAPNKCLGQFGFFLGSHFACIVYIFDTFRMYPAIFWYICYKSPKEHN